MKTTIQFAGVVLVFGVLTVTTVRDIMRDMKNKSKHGYNKHVV